MEDNNALGQGELQERRLCRDEVAELDNRLEKDWRQRSRQLWLAAGDANKRFFHQVANGRRRQNHIRLLRIGDRIHSDQTSVGQTLVDHFREFYRQGLPNQWKWAPTTVPTVNLAQQQHLICPFLVEEVKVAVWGLNSEGAPGPDGIPLFIYKEC